MTTLLDVTGIGPATAAILGEHGIHTPEQLAQAKLGTLMAIPGFSEIRATRVIQVARDLPVESLPTTTGEAKPAKQKKIKNLKKMAKGDQKKGKKAKANKKKKSAQEKKQTSDKSKKSKPGKKNKNKRDKKASKKK